MPDKRITVPGISDPGIQIPQASGLQGLEELIAINEARKTEIKWASKVGEEAVVSFPRTGIYYLWEQATAFDTVSELAAIFWKIDGTDVKTINENFQHLLFFNAINDHKRMTDIALVKEMTEGNHKFTWAASSANLKVDANDGLNGRAILLG